MTFAAQADATRCAEWSTFPELASFRQMPLQVSSAENPGRVSITQKLASFRQMPLRADQQPPQERDETHGTPPKPRAAISGHDY